MKASEVRSRFLSYFADRGHERVASASLVPANDPTLLFTNAGMVQFKDVFTGAESRPYKRATSSQKCVRAGGKHNDLEQVGKTARHHTFFEMLGNFSFGDYFKEDAIAWAWELLTGVYGIDANQLIITVFGGDETMGVGADDEARAIWKRVTGFGDDRVIGLGVKENFWMMGDTGPMGPCSEIHFANDAAVRARPLPTSSSPESEWDGWLEIWNLVFMQYERREKDGELFPLPAPSIDTGAGLERVSSVLQGVDSNYHTDLFLPLLAAAADVAGKKYGKSDAPDDVSMRVIADHARASAFLISDGVFPDKTKREYVLRRIFRRAVRHGKLLGIDEPFMHRMCDVVVDEMGDVYPDLVERRAIIRDVTLEEEKRFRATLDRGLGLLEDEFQRMAEGGQLDGEKVFQLYDTFGFPVDLTELIAEERGYTIDEAGFEQAMERQREQSGGGSSGDEAVEGVYKAVSDQKGATEFLGYDGTTGDGKVLAIVVDGAVVERASAGAKVAVVTDRTPFYAEAGGQIGDAGTATSASGALRIDDCKKPMGTTYFHLGEVTEGSIAVGDTLALEVDGDRRNRIRGNHSATHLLHLGLKKVLGDHVAQKGSLVGPDRLRFDFSHFAPMTDDEKRAVEDFVNREVLANRDSRTDVLPFDQAKERGAVAMFGEKYGDVVRVVQIGGESLEFCGGTHVGRAGDIGLIKIVGESGVAQGVRRLEAVSGLGAMDYLRRLEDELGHTSARLKTPMFEVADRTDKVLAEHKKLEKQIAELKGKLAAGGARDLMSDLIEIDGVKLLATSTEVADAKTLRDTGDKLRDKLGSGIVVLAGVDGDKVSLLAMVSKDLTGRFHAGKLLKSVAEVVGGRGGGRPDMAQGGGKDPSKVPQALEAAVREVRQQAENAD